VKSAGAEKQAVLNQRSAMESLGFPSLVAAGPATDAMHPGTKFGLEPPPKSVVPFAWPLLKTSGKPC
jgi:hypothetical protein